MHYRILEAADSANGKSFVAGNVASLAGHDFGCLWIAEDSALDDEHPVNAFDVYRERALSELARLTTLSITDIADYLYGIRNSLAHGKTDPLSNRHPSRAIDAGRALPIVKLLSRLAVESQLRELRHRQARRLIVTSAFVDATA